MQLKNKIDRYLRSPAYKLVVETAFKNWWLIAINLGTNVLSVVLEGSTLGLIYLAVSHLTTSESNNSLSADPAIDKTVLENFSFFEAFSPTQMFLMLVMGAVVLQIGLSLSNYANKVATAYLSAKAQPYVTGRVLERIMTFSYGCVSRYKVGDLVMYANEAAFSVDQQITVANNFLVSLSFALVYLLVIVRLSPTLAVAAAVLTLIVGSVQYKLIPRLRQVVKRVTATRVESAKYITESIQALRLLHTYGTQAETVTSAQQYLQRTEKQLQKRAFIFYLPEPILDSIPMIALSILATAAVLFQGEDTPLLPLLLTFLLALQRLSMRLKSLAGTVTLFTDNGARMMRLETILDTKEKIFEQSGPQLFSGLGQDIEFQSVSLSYGQDDSFALKDLTFILPLNQVTALVGESGAGKSSIVDLLLGLYPATEGQVLVNGKALENYDMRSWRSHIGVVSQDTFIFNNSILENLRYGRPSATLEEVIEAAKAAQAHRFILSLPEGYDTVVGERGYRLSGGQRQRLALARALVKQPEILVLDEATSALDSESEKLIQQALEQFQENRTVIVVAHRLSTIAEADQILVLSNGSIVERGTHQSLMGKSRRYARYWSLQSSVATR
ncbi:MAG: ABC transporter ATP-binding protein [Cyanobacteria bacterium J06560_6]